MREYELFKNLAESRNQNFEFHVGKDMASARDAQNIIERAKKLEEDGYINFTILGEGENYFVEFKGLFTEKGKEEIIKNGIESKYYK